MTEARKIAELILRSDSATRTLGLKLEEIRHGVYDVRVANQNGETIALFRGKSATVRGTWL